MLDRCFLLDLKLDLPSPSITAFHLGHDLLLNCTFTGLMFLTPVDIKLDSTRTFIHKMVDQSQVMVCSRIRHSTDAAEFLLATSSGKIGLLSISLDKHAYKDHTFVLPSVQPPFTDLTVLPRFTKLAIERLDDEGFGLLITGITSQAVFIIKIDEMPSFEKCLINDAILCPKLPGWKRSFDFEGKSVINYFWIDGHHQVAIFRDPLACLDLCLLRRDKDTQRSAIMKQVRVGKSDEVIIDLDFNILNLPTEANIKPITLTEVKRPEIYETLVGKMPLLSFKRGKACLVLMDVDTGRTSTNENEDTASGVMIDIKDTFNCFEHPASNLICSAAKDLHFHIHRRQLQAVYTADATLLIFTSLLETPVALAHPLVSVVDLKTAVDQAKMSRAIGQLMRHGKAAMAMISVD